MSPWLGEVSCTDKSMTVFSSRRPPQRGEGGWGGGANQVLDTVLEGCVHTEKNVICLCSLLVSGEGHPGVLDAFHLLEPGPITT